MAVRAALAAALLFLSCTAAATSPDDPNRALARFPSEPAAVTVDVVEVGGAQLANDVAATRLSFDGSPSDTWSLDLSQLPGYPANCEARTYVLRWTPQGGTCPADCAISSAELGGPLCRADPRVQVVYRYAESVVAAQGITETVLKHHEKRGAAPVRWRERWLVGGASPIEWEVYFYRQGAHWPLLACTVRTSTDPASSLPSSDDCD